MKIALMDLVHTTCGTHSNNVPLGIGLMGAYVKKNIAASVEIKLFKEAEKALGVFKTWIPDVVGITQYAWGSELNLYVASVVKKINPQCLVVAGGPNLYMDVKRRTAYLKKNKFVDICVAYDGEIPLLEIVQRLSRGETNQSLKQGPGAGTYSLDPVSGDYLESPLPPPRLKSLDDFGPIYAEGIFDKFLADGYHPMLQTHRGCPFSCAYCRTSDLYNSRMLFLSPEIFQQELDYLAKRFTGRSEIRLYLANTNMSSFQEDFQIARIIRAAQEKYDWPKYVFFDTGKDPKKLLAMLEIIKFVPSPALQTLTPAVLANINRKNLTLKEYTDFQKEILLRTGENSMSELILSLPGETKATFLETVRQVINSGVQNIVIYTLLKLPSTPLDSAEFSKKYRYVLRYRVVPVQFSQINGQKIIESEEVIVGTKDMPFEDYLELRRLHFAIAVFFGSIEITPIKRLLFENGVDLAQWLFNIHKRLKKYPEIERWRRAYLKETREELFTSRQELLKFFAKPKHFQELVSGKRGDNLVRKYKHLVLSNDYEAFLRVAIEELRRLIKGSSNAKKTDEMIDDLAIFLSARDLRPVFAGRKINSVRRFRLKYDIPAWLANDKKLERLENFKKEKNYLVAFDEQQKRALKHLDTHKGYLLSLQILYRDNKTKDLWPKWTPAIKNK